MFDDVYKNRKVMVIGHTGFKGSWLSAWLLKLGADLKGVSIGVPTEPSHFNVIELDKRLDHCLCDIRNRSALMEAISDFQPEIIFHLAAQALVRRSYEDPAFTFEVNALGTMNILECVRQVKSVKAVAVITSDKCYRNLEWVWGYRENDALGGDDPYSASKGCAEIIAASYMKSFFNHGEAPRIATARAGNVVGGGDWAQDRIIPDCVRAWTSDEPVTIRKPNATRPWQHVLEPLSGYLCLGASLFLGKPGISNEAFNFGPGTPDVQTVKQVVASLSMEWPGFEYRIADDQKAGLPESMLLKLNCDKAKAVLSWQTVLDFQEVMEMTASWYRAFHENRKSVTHVTHDQIHRYEKIAEMRGMPWAL